MGAGRFRAAMALPVAALLLTSCAQQPESADQATAGTGAWTELPPAPLAPRLGAVTAWTGSEALFLGGDVDDFCPPNARCPGPPESTADGAAFDPATQTWRPVAEAPHPIAAGTPSTVAGDTVYLVQDDRLLSYDASEDAWSVSPPAPYGNPFGAPAVMDDGRIALTVGERHPGDPSGLLYYPADRWWEDLPEDPLGPAYDRLLTAVPGGLVLTAVPTPDDRETAEPTLRAAVLDLDGDTWTALDGSRRTGGWNWAWTGERMVDVYPDGVNASGKRYAQSGALDPSSGEWSALPQTPAVNTGGWPVAARRGPLAAVDGWVYDDRSRTWTRVEQPSGAPDDPGSAVWAGDELIVLGGMDTDAGWGADHLSDRAWTWHAAAPAEPSAPSVATDDLTGVHWVLESLIVDGDTREPWAPAEASLDLYDDGVADVATGCVSATTRWRATGDAVLLEQFGWYAGCTEEALRQQEHVLGLLSDGFLPTVEGDVLTLVPTAPSGATLVYRAA
jgi:hypothetical protein